MNGTVKEALIDLTGHPTLELTLRDNAIYDMMKSNELWDTVIGFIDQDLLVSGCINLPHREQLDLQWFNTDANH